MFPMVIVPGSKKHYSIVFQIIVLTIVCIVESTSVLPCSPLIVPLTEISDLVLCPPPIPPWLVSGGGLPAELTVAINGPWQDPTQCTKDDSGQQSGWESLLQAIESTCRATTDLTTAGVSETLVESMNATNIPGTRLPSTTVISSNTLEITTTTSQFSATESKGIYESSTTSMITASTNTKIESSSQPSTSGSINSLLVSTNTLKISTSTLGENIKSSVDPSFTYVAGTTNAAIDVTTNTLTSGMTPLSDESSTTIGDNTTGRGPELGGSTGNKATTSTSTTRWYEYLIYALIGILVLSILVGIVVACCCWHKPETKIVPGVDMKEHNYFHNKLIKGIKYTKTDTNKNHLEPEIKPSKQFKTTKITDEHKMTPVENSTGKDNKEETEKFIGANKMLDIYSMDEETTNITKKKSDKKAEKKAKKLKLKESKKKEKTIKAKKEKFSDENVKKVATPRKLPPLPEKK